MVLYSIERIFILKCEAQYPKIEAPLVLVDSVSLPFRLLTPLTASSGFPINLKITSAGLGTNLSTPVSTNKLKLTAV